MRKTTNFVNIVDLWTCFKSWNKLGESKKVFLVLLSLVFAFLCSKHPERVFRQGTYGEVYLAKVCLDDVPV